VPTAAAAPKSMSFICIRQHTSAYVSIRQHTSAYGSIRQHTSAYATCCVLGTSSRLPGLMSLWHIPSHSASGVSICTFGLVQQVLLDSTLVKQGYLLH
jgi:hypothetical protein